jgi:redox-sensing transcriptional repressor
MVQELLPEQDGDTNNSLEDEGELIRVPTPTLERLTTYLRSLIEMGNAGIFTISSAQIETHTHISAAQFRKDLSYFGEFGKPGVGYNVTELEARIARILQIHKVQPIVLVGAGNLGSALVAYPGLEEHKFQIVAAFDNDPQKIGRRLQGMDIIAFERFGEVNGTLRSRMAILAVPAQAAQAAADTMIAQGIRALLNFAPIPLRVPPTVVVRNVSFLQELAVLSYQLTENERRVGK